MSSTFKVTRICEYCEQPFLAQTTTTRYCSHRCNQRGYKKRKREEKIAKSNSEARKAAKALAPIQKQEFLSIQDTCALLGVSRWTVYRAIDAGRLKAAKFGRRTLISRQAVDEAFGLSKADTLPEINIQINPSKFKQ